MLKQSLQQKLLQKLSPQQIQLMKLLQVPTLELEARIKQELEANGLLATSIQHGMDHLAGVLFVDHLTSLKRNMIIRKLQKTKKMKAAAE